MLIEFLLAAIIIELTPGPNMGWIALLAASRGARAALAAVAGITLGLSFAATAAALGVSALIATTPWLFQALRWAGALYLLYLAWDALKNSTIKTDEQLNKNLARYFGQGLLSNMLNPKAYLVYVAVLPQFITTTQPVLAQLITLSIIYVAVATIIHAAIAIFAGKFTIFFENPNRAALLGKIFAALLTIMAIWFFYSTEAKP